MNNSLFTYTLRLADTALILGHRLSEWAGHAPMLEEDLAIGNMGLDLIGQARSFYDYAGKLEGKGRSEDDLAYLRDVNDWRNLLLVEQPRGDFAYTILRQFLFAAYAHPLFERLMASKDETLAAISAKAVKEMAYHLRHAGEWVIRLGDGTEESAARMNAALTEIWPYTGEMFAVSTEEQALIKAGIAVDPALIRPIWEASLQRVFSEAMLSRPADGWMQMGGVKGEHSEHLGHLLADLQYLQRAYPGATW